MNRLAMELCSSSLTLKNEPRARMGSPRGWVGTTALTLTSMASLVAAVNLNAAPVITHLWTTTSTLGAEIVEYAADTDHLWVVSPAGLEVRSRVDGSLIQTIAAAGANSVAIRNGVAAVAIAAADGTQNGLVRLFDTASFAPLNDITVGVLPDMVTFAADGRILVANEGERSGGIDPEGSISVIDITDPSAPLVTALRFDGFDVDTLRAQGVRIEAGFTFADLEPEYIAVSPDGTQAFVTLQEANSVAIVDLSGASATISEIVSLGTKDHSIAGQGLDPSDRDGKGMIRTVPVHGLYMPDAVDSYAVGGETFYVFANEGDSRGEDERAGDVLLDPTAFPNALALQDDTTGIGRLDISTIDGDIDGDGDFDQLFSYGARSFSIRDDEGNLIFDSGDAIERILFNQFPDLLDDGRSDNKGPEPEAIELFSIGGLWYALVGLERANSVMLWDITDPNSPSFLTLIAHTGDIGPEGVRAFRRDGNTFFAVANEVSRTTSLFRVNVPAPATGALLTLLLAAIMRRNFVK